MFHIFFVSVRTKRHTQCVLYERCKFTLYRSRKSNIFPLHPVTAVLRSAVRTTRPITVRRVNTVNYVLSVLEEKNYNFNRPVYRQFAIGGRTDECVLRNERRTRNPIGTPQDAFSPKYRTRTTTRITPRLPDWESCFLTATLTISLRIKYSVCSKETISITYLTTQ